MDTSSLMHGFDAGHFTLPPELVTTARAVEPLQAALDEQEYAPTMVAEAKAQFQASVLEAARARKKLPTAEALIKARMAAETQGEVTTILREGLRQAERHLALLFFGLQPKILLEHLRPAFDETISEAKKAKASELDAHRIRYSMIRSARSTLHRIPAPARDKFGTFAEFKDADRWWPEFYPERMRKQIQGMVTRSVKEIKERESKTAPTFTPAPWPADASARFKWSIEHAEPWLPTPEEQDDRFDEYLKLKRTDLSKRQQQWREENWQAAH